MSSHDNSGKRILVIEDDFITSGAVKMVLEWEGYRVDCAANGREALDHLRQPGEKPDLILLDTIPPALGARHFRDEQKRDPALEGIPVVVISGAAVSSGFDDFGQLRKPFQPEELLEAIRHQM